MLGSNTLEVETLVRNGEELDEVCALLHLLQGQQLSSCLCETTPSTVRACYHSSVYKLGVAAVNTHAPQSVSFKGCIVRSDLLLIHHYPTKFIQEILLQLVAVFCQDKVVDDSCGCRTVAVS